MSILEALPILSLLITLWTAEKGRQTVMVQLRMTQLQLELATQQMRHQVRKKGRSRRQ